MVTESSFVTVGRVCDVAVSVVRSVPTDVAVTRTRTVSDEPAPTVTVPPSGRETVQPSLELVDRSKVSEELCKFCTEKE